MRLTLAKFFSWSRPSITARNPELRGNSSISSSIRQDPAARSCATAACRYLLCKLTQYCALHPLRS